MAKLIRGKPFRVSIEGNIGSGKSTCLNYFAKFNNIETHPEPIEQWRNVSGHNLLGCLYKDLSKWNFTFQHYVQLTRLQIQTSPPLSEQIKIKMYERSVQNNRHCFVENARKNKYITECEFEVLKSWYEFLEEHMDIDLDLIVYLKSTPEIVWHRMVKRGRNEESMVPLKYLKEIHASYEEWFNSPGKIKCKVITINADEDLDNVMQQLESSTPLLFAECDNAKTRELLLNVSQVS